MSEAEELLKKHKMTLLEICRPEYWNQAKRVIDEIDAYLARPVVAEYKIQEYGVTLGGEKAEWKTAADGVVVPPLAEIRGAVARGWCHKVNEHKTMDTDLALAIADEVNAMLSAAPSVKGGTE